MERLFALNFSLQFIRNTISLLLLLVSMLEAGLTVTFSSPLHLLWLLGALSSNYFLLSFLDVTVKAKSDWPC